MYITLKQEGNHDECVIVIDGFVGSRFVLNDDKSLIMTPIPSV